MTEREVCSTVRAGLRGGLDAGHVLGGTDEHTLLALVDLELAYRQEDGGTSTCPSSRR